MVNYCENKADCRRSQQMLYFGEILDRRHCAQMPRAVCDNCSSKVCITHSLSIAQRTHSNCVMMSSHPRCTNCAWCKFQETFTEVDASAIAKNIVEGVKAIVNKSGPRQRYTLIHFMEVFKGTIKLFSNLKFCSTLSG
jgi:bloom syndrome protein